jgi:hypothetical protein
VLAFVMISVLGVGGSIGLLVAAALRRSSYLLILALLCAIPAVPMLVIVLSFVMFHADGGRIDW